MQYEVKEVSSIRRSIAISLDAEEVGAIEKDVLSNIRKNASLPGFRKGKAPAGLIRQTYGSLIHEEIQEKAINKYFREVMDKVDLKAIDYHIHGEDIAFESADKGMSFEVHVEVEPDIEVQNYKGLAVEKEVTDVTDEMVEKELDHIRKRFATSEPAEVAEKGYLVTFNAQELDDSGMAIIGRKIEDYTVEIGSGEFDAEAEDQLVGLKSGDTTRIVRSTPGEGDQPPKVERYELEITRIEKQELPELDDEFVQSLQDESVATVDELRGKMRGDMESYFTKRGEQILRNRLIDELLKENPVEVPPAMVNNYLQSMIDDMKRRAGKNQRVDEDAVRQHYENEAMLAVRWHLIKQKLIEVENLTVTDDDVRAHIDTLPYSNDEKETMKKGGYFLDHFRRELLDEKVMKFLESEAKITEVKPEDPS